MKIMQTKALYCWPSQFISLFWPRMGPRLYTISSKGYSPGHSYPMSSITKQQIKLIYLNKPWLEYWTLIPNKTSLAKDMEQQVFC